MHEPPLLVVMAKAPVCGAVKTRLAKEIGAVRAAATNRVLTAALLREVTPDPRFLTVLAISPDHAFEANFTAWGPLAGKGRHGHPRFGVKRMGEGALRRIEQGRGGLGQRMQRIFDRCGQGPLIIVGTDIPFITRGMIAEAFRRLRGADAVFGPAEDGGYWLVGLRRRPKLLRPFAGVRWSSEHALAGTLKNLSAHRVAFAKTLFDIDTLADYRRYLRERYRLSAFNGIKSG
jgi:rSAM/selenodomain-associated transferase 1